MNVYSWRLLEKIETILHKECTIYIVLYKHIISTVLIIMTWTQRYVTIYLEAFELDMNSQLNADLYISRKNTHTGIHEEYCIFMSEFLSNMNASTVSSQAQE